jgi:hypothetical protein
LPKLNDIDKHRYLHLCVLYIQRSTVALDSSGSAEENEDLLKAFSKVPVKNLEYGTELFSIPSKYRLKFFLPRFDVGFSEDSQIISNESVLEIINKMSKQVSGVLSALENEVEKG